MCGREREREKREATTSPQLLGYSDIRWSRRGGGVRGGRYGTGEDDDTEGARRERDVQSQGWKPTEFKLAAHAPLYLLSAASTNSSDR